MSQSESDVDADRTDWEGFARRAAGQFQAVGQDDGTELLRELLVFGLDESAYAIAVERVREIVRTRDLTYLPRSPDWLPSIRSRMPPRRSRNAASSTWPKPKSSGRFPKRCGPTCPRATSGYATGNGFSAAIAATKVAFRSAKVAHANRWPQGHYVPTTQHLCQELNDLRG